MSASIRIAVGLLSVAGWLWGGVPQQQPSSAGRAEEIETARKLIADGSVDDAVKVLRNVVAADPDDADAHLLLGTALALVPRRSEALASLRRAVELQPDAAQAHLTLGMVLARFGDLEAARPALEKAISLDHRLAAAHVNLAMILAAREELDSAIDHLSQAIESSGESPAGARYHYLRGKMYRQQDLLERAQADFEKAVELGPDYGKAYLELGLTLADRQDEAGALEALERAVALAPDDAEARYQLGTHYLRAGEAERSVEHLQAAARMQPDNRSVLYSLARALRGAGRVNEAKPLMERLSKLAEAQTMQDPEILKAGELNNEGIALEKEGKFAAALQKYREALKISPRQVGFRKNLALVLCRLGRWQEAIAELDDVLEVAPGDVDAIKALYIALEKRNDTQ